jgi:transitional endoplasmic reticulum ATPase
MLDSALLRPGRFDKILLVDAPDEKSRENILKIHTRAMPLGDGKKLLTDKERSTLLSDLSGQTAGYTGADLESLAREAAMLSLRESAEAKYVQKKHFEEALNKVRPSVTKSTLEVYKKMEENFIRSARVAIPTSGSYLG